MSNEMQPQPTTVRLTSEQRAKLGEIAAEWGCTSHSEVIGRFIDSWSSDVVRKAVTRAALPQKLPAARRYRVMRDFAGTFTQSGVMQPIALYEGTVVVREMYPVGHFEQL
jgi:hypothetical protein